MSEYIRVIVSASTRVSAVALRCIMHVWCVCVHRIFMMCDTTLMNAEVSVEFKGIHSR